MADLDTTSKRRSSVMHSQPWVAAYLLADGTIAQGDRQHIALSYSGILAAAAGGGRILNIVSYGGLAGRGGLAGKGGGLVA